MFYYAIKILITLVLIIAVAEIAKRSTLIGGLVASVPLVSVLALVWLYVDTQDTARVAQMASSILWLVLPSLTLFISLPVLLNYGVNSWISLVSSLAIMIICYLLMLLILSQSGPRSLGR